MSAAGEWSSGSLCCSPFLSTEIMMSPNFIKAQIFIGPRTRILLLGERNLGPSKLTKWIMFVLYSTNFYNRVRATRFYIDVFICCIYLLFKFHIDVFFFETIILMFLFVDFILFLYCCFYLMFKITFKFHIDVFICCLLLFNLFSSGDMISCNLS